MRAKRAGRDAFGAYCGCDGLDPRAGVANPFDAVSLNHWGYSNGFDPDVARLSDSGRGVRRQGGTRDWGVVTPD